MKNEPVYVFINEQGTRIIFCTSKYGFKVWKAENHFIVEEVFH